MLDESTDDELATLTAREVCQILRDVIFGRRTLLRAGSSEGDDSCVDIDGWRISLHGDHGALDHCTACVSPAGRHWRLDAGARFGTDPVALLSTWEHETLERLLKAL